MRLKAHNKFRSSKERAIKQKCRAQRSKLKKKWLINVWSARGTQRLFSVKYLFGKANVRGLEFSVRFRTANISRCPWPLCKEIFKVCLINFPWFSELYFFTFHSQCWTSFRMKRKPKIFGFTNVTEKGKQETISLL